MRFAPRKCLGRDPGGWGNWAPRYGARADWLRETGSLTARLQRSGATTVQVLRQGLRRPHRDERRVLHAGEGDLLPVRDVVLRVAGRPAVFAHTVANAAAMRLLRRAGGKPLATVLFTDPRVRIGPLYFCRVDARHPLHRLAATWCDEPPPRFVARRALFARGAARLLVTEVFLPWREHD